MFKNNFIFNIIIKLFKLATANMQGVRLLKKQVAEL
jgi:hypothetical protein